MTLTRFEAFIVIGLLLSGALGFAQGGGVETQAVDYNTLIWYLPYAPYGWGEGVPEGTMYTIDDGTWSVAAITYSNYDDAYVTADVGIMDSAYYTVGWWDIWDELYTYDDIDGYAEPVTVNGYPAWEVYTSEWDEYCLLVDIEERFLVYICTNSDWNTLYQFANLIDYDGIAALGDESDDYYTIAPTPTDDYYTIAPTPTDDYYTIAPTPTDDYYTIAPTPSPPDGGGGGLFIAALVLIILFVVARSWRKGGKSAKPKPPAEPQKPKIEPQPKQEPVIKPVSPIQEPDINITSAFGYKGATIIHKIKVENPAAETVGDIKIRLFVPEVFLLKDTEKHIGLLKPGESKTVTFEIRPTGECGDCEVSGRATYYDYASRKTKEVDIPAKSLSIVCPMLKAQKIDKPAWKDTVMHLIQAEESTTEIEIPAETLFTMASRVIEDLNMFMLEPEVTSTAQLYNGVARFYAKGVKELTYAAQIEVVGGTKKSKLILRVWAEKEAALTGFYHGILDEIEKRVQVKGYIDDSIVQQYYQVGTLVKDSVVQRSTIGTEDEAGKKCPRCGRAVSADERYCPECGEKLQ
jgi:hypothetical protein